MRAWYVFPVGAAAVLIAGGLVVAQDLSSTGVPPDEAPFDENPFDLTAPENELDVLSRSVADPFPTLQETQSRRPVSVTLRALDKITARYTDIDVSMNEPARFNSLEIVARYCDKRPPEEFPETTAFLEVYDRDLARARVSASATVRRAAPPPAVAATAPDQSAPGAPAQPMYENSPAIDPDRIFSGWMFASSPALNALEHPVYDVWVIDCKTVVVESEAPPL